MDWKKQRKIDGHIHLLPDEVHKANADMDNEFSYAKVENHIQLMNQLNIEKSIIMTFNDPYLMSMNFTVSAVHKNLQQLCEMYPGRYFAFADIDIRNRPEKSCEEIKKAFQSKCFKGIKIHPNNTGMNVDDVYNDYIFDLAESLKVPVAIHSYPSSRKKYDKHDYCTPSRISKIMHRHPKVDVIICHLGGFQWKDSLELNAAFDISSILPDFVKEYGIKETNRILRQFDLNKLLFASDWPCSRSLKPKAIYEEYYDLLNAMDFSKEEVEQMAYCNIKNLLTL